MAAVAEAPAAAPAPLAPPAEAAPGSPINWVASDSEAESDAESDAVCDSVCECDCRKCARARSPSPAPASPELEPLPEIVAPPPSTSTSGRAALRALQKRLCDRFRETGEKVRPAVAIALHWQPSDATWLVDPTATAPFNCHMALHVGMPRCFATYCGKILDDDTVAACAAHYIEAHGIDDATVHFVSERHVTLAARLAAAAAAADPVSPSKRARAPEDD